MDTAIRQQVTPMLAANHAAAAIEFYKAAFGAKVIGEPYAYEGKIGHAELEIFGGLVFLADEFAGQNQSPTQLNGTSVVLHLDVADCDAVTAQTVEAGAELIRAPETFPYGRISKVRDPFGHVWMIDSPATS
jgi:uncharacterized glyoxalase superfamily protein PhnB